MAGAKPGATTVGLLGEDQLLDDRMDARVSAGRDLGALSRAAGGKLPTPRVPGPPTTLLACSCPRGPPGCWGVAVAPGHSLTWPN